MLQIARILGWLTFWALCLLGGALMVIIIAGEVTSNARLLAFLCFIALVFLVEINSRINIWLREKIRKQQWR